MEEPLESLKAEVAKATASAPPTSSESNPDAGQDTPAVVAVSDQVVVSPVIQPAFAPAQVPVRAAQTAALNHPVLPVSPLSKATLDQAASGKSGHNLPAGRYQPPAVNPTSVDHHGGKERGARGDGPGEAKQETTGSDAAKAVDQAGAKEAPTPKEQQAPGGNDNPPAPVVRAEVLAQSGSDPSPKTGASSPAPVHNAAANNSLLQAERPSEPLFQSAQLVEKISQSELRLGMRTGEFGNVEIRTSFDHQQVKAEISSERGELGRMLSSEMPGLEQRMRERDVPLSAVVVHEANAGAAGSFDRNPRHQQPSPTPQRWSEASGVRSAAAASQPEVWEPQGILDVRI